MKISETPDSFTILHNVWNDEQLGRKWMDDYTDYYSNDGVFSKEEAAEWRKTHR